MTALLLPNAPDAAATALTRRSLAAGFGTARPAASASLDQADDPLADVVGSAVELPAPSATPTPSSASFVYNERWLQELLFAHPELVLIDQMEPGAGSLVALCRELAIPRLGGSVFLDVLGVTRTGRLVLIECKLWRNPQARREVVAQILEYAALLRGWSFEDLTARLKQRHGYTGENPIFARAKQVWHDLDEAAFTDGVSRSLSLADFHLVIAGDGIRSDLQAVATHLGATGGMSRLSLLEIQLWTDGTGQTLVVPSVPLRTEVITQRVLLLPNGQPVQIEEQPQASGSVAAASEKVERLADPAAANRRTANRAFWQRFIDDARFDHPDQSPPRHGGNNWVQLDLPQSIGGITAYRSGDPVRNLGVFLRLRGEDGRRRYDDLVAKLADLSAESGLQLVASISKEEPFSGSLGAYCTESPPTSDAEQLRWLTDTANRFSSAVRLHLSSEKDDLDP